MMGISSSVIDGFKLLSSSMISDAMDRAGLHGTVEGIKSQVPGIPMCGSAYTVRYILQGASGGRFADFLDDVPPGAVVAIDNSGLTNCSVWGDTLSLFATTKGFAGTAIDGICRDIAGTRAFNYPMFSRGTFMRTGKGRVVIESLQSPIVLGGVPVRSGDVLFGDDTGLVVVPMERAEEVLDIAQKIVVRDNAVASAIKSGSTIIEAWRAGSAV
jgi:4-hydroxy-4-methyl-2-oxoglutarate aldolase